MIFRPSIVRRGQLVDPMLTSLAAKGGCLAQPRSSGQWQPLLMAVTLACSLLGSPVHAAADGARVILVRHADKDVGRGDYNLSPVGFLRAMALGRLIPACYGTPTEISSFYLDPITGKNARSYQTAVPLAVSTGVNIQIMEASVLDSFVVGQQLRQRLVGTDGLHVLFWEHRRMPDVARGLGWSTMPAIGDADYDQLIVFRYDKQAGLTQVEDLSQRSQFGRACFKNAQTPWAFEADLKLLLPQSEHKGQP